MNTGYRSGRREEQEECLRSRRSPCVGYGKSMVFQEVGVVVENTKFEWWLHVVVVYVLTDNRVLLANGITGGARSNPKLMIVIGSRADLPNLTAYLRVFADYRRSLARAKVKGEIPSINACTADFFVVRPSIGSWALLSLHPVEETGKYRVHLTCLVKTENNGL